MRVQTRLVPALALLAACCAYYASAPLATAFSLTPALSAGVPSAPLSVEDVVALAVTRNPDLVVARTKLGVAQAQLAQAGVLPNPLLTDAILSLIAGRGTGPA